MVSSVIRDGGVFRTQTNSAGQDFPNQQNPENCYNLPAGLAWDQTRGGIVKRPFPAVNRRISSIFTPSSLQQSVCEHASGAVSTAEQRRSMTLDNALESPHYGRLEKHLRTELYFADLDSPWQRGTHEWIPGPMDPVERR